MTREDESAESVWAEASPGDVDEVIPDQIEGFDDPDVVGLEALEPDLSDDIGTNDVMYSVESGEPYYPPTDPVIAPLPNDQGGARAVNAFAPSSEVGFDDTGALEDTLAVPDDELALTVRDALQADALTADLDIDVSARQGVVILRGEVPTLDDAENAEAVAGRVAGVVDVREELSVAAM